MMNKFLLIPFFLLLIFSTRSSAQITNLTVDGSSTSFTMTSGDTVTWSYNVTPAGAGTLVEIWYDVNQNGVIDPGTDVLWQSFVQTDGDTVGNDGPPDMDGHVNGAVLLKMPIGLAPGKYVLKFTEGGGSLSVAGTVNPLLSPAHTISGTVTPPSGKSAAYIFVEAHRSRKHQPNFWNGVTDASGNYTIQMNADTAGNPWRVNIVSNPYRPAIVTPSDTSVTIAQNLTGINFSMASAAAQVDGYVKDESGTALVNMGLSLSRLDSVNKQSTVQYFGKADVNAFFQMGVKSQDLIAGRTWRLFAQPGNSNSDLTTTQLAAIADMQINSADSIFKNLTIYNANSQIQGRIEINGAAPGFSIEIVGDNSDTAQAATMSDASSGNFTLSVSNKIFNYQLFPIRLPANYYVSPVTAHPGNSGIVISMTTTAVNGRKQSVPTEFSLHQNYPNPFNPATTITYDIAKTSNVTIAVYNILGQKVATLVNEAKNAGEYSVSFDGSGIASGVYFYRMTAGNYSSMKKFVLMK